jgi:hypothetical protein
MPLILHSGFSLCAEINVTMVNNFNYYFDLFFRQIYSCMTKMSVLSSLIRNNYSEQKVKILSQAFCIKINLEET